ncbi:MAG TPA: EAL domain-containing protein [Noviherbaspirillum sp.]|nr:EAL domain-containing protein [Noviherbaspirillum sp.]
MTRHQGQSYALQPIVDVASGAPLYMEMLVRFADGRNVQHTVMQKEDSRTIHEIDLWMLREAESTLARSADDRRLAVNISPVTIERYYNELLDIIDHFRARPARLVIEITETAPILEPHYVAGFAMSARAAGMAIALDDYGNGFCDASRFLLLQPNFIKVAKTGRGGWRAMPARERRALRSLADARQVPLIGEGVESANDLEDIRSFGFHFAQGYYLGTEVQAEQTRLTAGTAAAQSIGKLFASQLT